MVLPRLLLAAAVFFVSGSSTTELVHRMPVGRTVEVTLRQEESSRVDSMTWCPVVGGEPVTDQVVELDVEEEHAFEITIHWTDRYGELDGQGRLTSLQRSFESIHAPTDWRRTIEGETESSTDDWTTPLLGRTVEFTLDGDEGTYDAAFAEEGRATGFDAALLEGLAVDAFGDWYLPESGEARVEPGDTWDAGVEAWHRTLDIGGDFWVGEERDEPPTDEEVAARRAFRGQLRSGGSGEVLCTYVGLRKVDDVELAVLEIEIDVEVSAKAESSEEPEGSADVSVITSLLLEVEGAGTCLWDVEAGLPRSLVLSVTWRSSDLRIEEPADGEPGNAWSTVTDHSLELEYRFAVQE